MTDALQTLPLKGQTALVTGGSRLNGMGAEIARQLAANGCNIALAYYRPYDQNRSGKFNPTEPAQLIEQLREWPVEVHGFEVDLAQPMGPHQLFTAVRETFDVVNILVNNAGYCHSSGIDELNAAALDRHYVVNVRATTLLCTEFARAHSPGNAGRIINLSSSRHAEPMTEHLALAATCGAVEALTLTLSTALASLGITVNTVDPGITDTGYLSVEQRRALERDSLAGRVGTPRDAANIITFLASPASAWVTGQTIHSRGR